MNVVQFGADPTGQLDSSGAFRNACVAAAGSGWVGGGTVQVPPGSYTITSTVNMNPGTTYGRGCLFIGAGRHATTVQCKVGPENDCFTMIAPNVEDVYGVGGGLKGMWIYAASDWPRSPSAANAAHIVNIQNWQQWILEDLALQGSGSDVVYLKNPLDATLRNVHAEQGLGNGMYASAVSTLAVYDSYFNNNSGSGVSVDGFSILFSRSVFESNGRTGASTWVATGEGATVRFGYNITFVAPHFEANAGHDLHVGSTSTSPLANVVVISPIFSTYVGKQIGYSSIFVERGSATLIGGFFQGTLLQYSVIKRPGARFVSLGFPHQIRGKDALPSALVPLESANGAPPSWNDAVALRPTGADAYRVMLWFPGKVTGSQVLARYVLDRAVDFPDGLVGSWWSNLTNSTASMALGVDFSRAGVSRGKGTVTVAPNGAATFALPGGYLAEPGDVVTITAPGSDATLAGLSLTLVGTSR